MKRSSINLKKNKKWGGNLKNYHPILINKILFYLFINPTNPLK
jgi:hypothetical protein